MKKILVTVNPEYEPEDGTHFDAVFSALEHFDIPANLVEVNEDAPNPKGDALVDALKICGGILDWAIDHGGDKVSLESIKRMSAGAIARYEDTDNVTRQYEVFKGHLDFEGVVLNVEFQAPVGSTVAEKDAAFMAALAQQADVNYLSIGETKEEFLAMQLEEEDIARWLSRQIEDGHMALEDIPQIMARYALADPAQMSVEIAERMEMRRDEEGCPSPRM